MSNNKFKNGNSEIPLNKGIMDIVCNCKSCEAFFSMKIKNTMTNGLFCPFCRVNQSLIVAGRKEFFRSEKSRFLFIADDHDFSNYDQFKDFYN